jgi:hypothetical protein
VSEEEHDQPLTPEEEARIRAQQRRLWAEARIRDDEWRRAEGFPYWPRWVLPVGGVLLGILILLVGLFVALLVPLIEHPRHIEIHMQQGSSSP